MDLLDMLEDAMKNVDDQIRSARLEYRVHGDIDAYWSIVVERLTFLFKAIGYGIGHADWIAENAEENTELASKYAQKLNELTELPSGWLLDACREAVQPFFILKEWTGQDIYDPLINVLEKLLNQYGMFTRLEKGEMHVDLPYTGFHDL